MLMFFVLLIVILFVILFKFYHIEGFYWGNIVPPEGTKSTLGDKVPQNMTKHHPIIYQGHGIPLMHEDHPTIPIDKSMFYFNNYQCRPECCTFSPFSCTNGCVCWEAPSQLYIAHNSKITPRS